MGTDKINGEISLNHQLSPTVSINIDHGTDGNTTATLDLSINKNADVSVSKNNQGNTNVTLNVKI